MKGLDSISVALLALDITWSLLSLSLSLSRADLHFISNKLLHCSSEKENRGFLSELQPESALLSGIWPCQNSPVFWCILECRCVCWIRRSPHFGVFWNADVYTVTLELVRDTLS